MRCAGAQLLGAEADPLSQAPGDRNAGEKLHRQQVVANQLKHRFLDQLRL
jgi:hypothetical protein